MRNKKDYDENEDDFIVDNDYPDDAWDAWGIDREEEDDGEWVGDFYND